MLTFTLWICAAKTTNVHIIVARYSRYHILFSDMCQWEA